MAFRNARDRYGLGTRALHWVMALLVIGALGFGTWLVRSEPSLAKIPYYAMHKSVGITVFALVVLRLFWHRISPTPSLVDHGWQTMAARWVHRLFYVLLIAMPLSGWVASSATGIETVVFNAFTLPSIAPNSERWAEVGFAVHGALGFLLAVLVVLHVAGAISRRDGTLSRMLRGTTHGENGS